MRTPIRLSAPLPDGGELRLEIIPPRPVVDTTADPVDDEPSGVRPALAKCAPEPRLTTARQMRGHLRRVA